MKRNFCLFLFLFFPYFLLNSCGDPSRNYVVNAAQKVYDSEFIFELEPIAEGLISPVGLTHAGDGSGRLFLVSQSGKIYIIKNGKVLKEPFLDTTPFMVKIKNSYTEKGLLGLAFHPKYNENGRFFVYYSAPSEMSDHKSVIVEFSVSKNDPDKATGKPKTILIIPQPESNHNGGQLAFGPDGYLYVGLGDGGGGGDKHGDIGNGQNIESLLGSIIRIDVNTEEPYAIPKDNPFADSRVGRPELFAFGLRNPWRFSFDRKTGQLFCGDVGQSNFEEVNLVEKGKNYGWRAMEGMHIYDNELYGKGRSGEYILPVIEYDHKEGVSIIGGYVYRGEKYPHFQGYYLFGDWSGKLYYLQNVSENQWRRHFAVLKGTGKHETPFRINSFGEDEQGELYIVGQHKAGGENKSGVLYRVKVITEKSK